MTKNQITIQYLIRKLRYKYRENGDLKNNQILDRIIWHSMPVVYPDCDKDMREVTRAIERRKEKKKRINGALRDMLQSYDELYFVTLTFNDDSLERLSERTRHRYVQQWLNDNCKDYIANADYGSKSGREHFHAVVAYGQNKSEWKYGFKSSKKALKSHEDKERWKMSSYLLKLTNHACKVGTGKSFRKRGMKEVDNLPF